MREKPIVVYDVDDTLWALNKIVCRQYGIDLTNIVTYKLNDNPILTSEQKSMMLSAYGDPDIFRKCEFFSGYDHVFDINNEGIADVWLSSANMNAAVMAVKEKRLRKEVPNIDMEHVRLTCSDSIYQGRVHGDILVDDSLINMERGDFTHNILIDYPYNRNPDDVKRVNKDIIRVNSLSEAIKVVDNIIRKGIKI